MDFWIIIDQRHAGPFSIEQLREQGITPDRLVWHDGLTDWTPAGEIPALTELFTAEEPASRVEPCPPAPPVEETSEPQAAAAEEPRQQQWQQQPPRQQEWQQPRQPRPDPEYHYGGNPGWQQQQPPRAEWQQPYGNQQPPYGNQQPYGSQQQPPYNGGVPQCPPTYLVWAIITTICCCTPAGIVAIIYAANIKNAYYRGDYMKAERNSSRAQIWIIASIVLGLLSVPLQIGYYGILDMFNF